MNRQDWMATYAQALTTAIPELTGKLDQVLTGNLDQATADYFYKSGRSPVEAANIIITGWYAGEGEA